MTLENIDIFVRMSEARSREHQQAMKVALDHGWLAIAGCVLRMELDSMMRAIYLLRHPDVRDSILASCVAGKGFRVGGKRIQDREVMEDAEKAMAEDAIHVSGWVKAVYEFGNEFVHLTNAHDYAVEDPFEVYDGRDAVIKYLNHYHANKVAGGPLDGSSATLHDLSSYAPYVLEKITVNLYIYLKNLRKSVGG